MRQAEFLRAPVGFTISSAEMLSAASAFSREVRGLNRDQTVREKSAVSDFSFASKISGVQQAGCNAAEDPGSWKPRGMIPTIVYPTPSNVIDLPTAVGRPLNNCCHMG